MRPLAALSVLAAAAAVAHTPGRLAPDAPWPVQHPEVSYAVYGEFVTGEERFVLQLRFEERFAAPVEVFVPHQGALEDHRPAWALVGPGLPPPSDEERAALPAALPDGWGAVVDLNTVSPRPVFYEFVMRRFYWTSGAMAVVFPAGDSELWVFSPRNTTGKFGLGFGVEEGGGYLAALRDWCFYAY